MVARRIRTILAGSAAFAATALAPATAFASTAALWHMNETSGSTMHDAVDGHDGRVRAVHLGVPGFSGTAYEFSRPARSVVTVPSAGDLNPGAGAFTISLHVWATQAPPSGDYDLVKKGSYWTPGGEYKVELQNGRALCAFKGSKHYAAVTGGPNLLTGRWFTVRCTKTSSAVILQVSGQTVRKSVDVGPIANTSPVGIGAAPGSDYMTGRLDEISLIHGT